MGRALQLSLGLLALLTTIALICDGIVLAVQISNDMVVRTTSMISVALEATVWAMLAWFVSATVLNSMASMFRRSSIKRLAVSFGCAASACMLAAIMVIVNIARLASLVDVEVANGTNQTYLIASSVILAVTITCQLSFLGVYFLICRRNHDEGAESVYTNDDYRPSPKFHVKSIPYTKTRPSMAESRPPTSSDSVVDMRSLEGKRSFQVTASPRSSMCQSIRSVPSKTRLGAIKEKQRLPSLDSYAYRPSVDDHDNWDASSGYSRQDSSSPTVLAFPKPRLLETIPASPIVPEGPTSMNDLQPPPPIRQRSRSYSPAARKPRSMTSSPTPSNSTEEHIHPLFRSGSPTPPPVVTPGTSVMASPDAGKVLPHRPSNQSLRRLRSSSATSNCSPLSRKTSFEAPCLQKPCDEQDSILEVDEDDADTVTEEELTPPIPEFIMGAGCRSSLTRYNSKRSDHEAEQVKSS